MSEGCREASLGVGDLEGGGRDVSSLSAHSQMLPL